jgi:hypothetical protein
LDDYTGAEHTGPLRGYNMNWVDGIIIAAFASGVIWGVRNREMFPAFILFLVCIFSLSIAALFAEPLARATGGAPFALVLTLALFFGIPMFAIHRSGGLRLLERNVKWVAPEPVCQIGAPIAAVMIVAAVLAVIFDGALSLAQKIMPVWFISIGGEVAVDSIRDSSLAMWEIGVFVWFSGPGGIAFLVITGAALVALALRARKLEGRDPLHAMIGEMEKFRKLHEESQRGSRVSSSSHFHRAMEYEAAGDYDDAVVGYTRAIQLDRKFSLAYFNRGSILAMQGKMEDAANDFFKVLTLSEGTDLEQMARMRMEELGL